MTVIDDIAGLGAKVRAARTAAGMTQGALATACGLSRQTITQLEAGTYSDLGMRKIGRVLERLGLRLEVRGTARQPAATGTGSRFERLLQARGEARRRTALRLAEATLRALGRTGVAACVVGSLAKGKFRSDSDVDYLIEDRGGVPESRITSVIEASMRGFPFDVIYAERADPVLLTITRSEAKRGASALRTA